MKGYRLDLARLAREYAHPSEDPYLVVGRMLRAHLGGDPLAELQEQVRRSSMLRAMVEQLADERSAASLLVGPSRRTRPWLSVPNRPRRPSAVDEISETVDPAGGLCTSETAGPD